MVGNLLLHFNGGGNSTQTGISLYRAYHTLHRERHLSEEGALSCEISVKRADMVLTAFLLASLCRSISAAPPEVFSSPLLFSPHMSALDLVYVSGPLSSVKKSVVCLQFWWWMFRVSDDNLSTVIHVSPKFRQLQSLLQFSDFTWALKPPAGSCVAAGGWMEVCASLIWILQLFSDYI